VAHYDSIDAFVAHCGESLGTTDWQVISQSRITAFADVTGDHQWIHTDPDRAADGPFKTTVAHGALTLSLCAAFIAELVEVASVDLVVNAGLDRVRFLAPVPAGARVRGTGQLIEARRLATGARCVVRTRVEVADQPRPACVADWILMFR
jgi:acyl dehydratase